MPNKKPQWIFDEYPFPDDINITTEPCEITAAHIEAFATTTTWKKTKLVGQNKYDIRITGDIYTLKMHRASAKLRIDKLYPDMMEPLKHHKTLLTKFYNELKLYPNISPHSDNKYFVMMNDNTNAIQIIGKQHFGKFLEHSELSGIDPEHLVANKIEDYYYSDQYDMISFYDTYWRIS